MNHKLQDRQRILSFLEAHPVTTVEAITRESGANRLRIHPLLFELAQENIIQVVEESGWGAPTAVKLKKN